MMPLDFQGFVRYEDLDDVNLKTRESMPYIEDTKAKATQYSPSKQYH